MHLAPHVARNIWRFRLRSSLMLLSGVLGVAGVTAASSYAAEGRLQVLEQIRRMGSNVLVVAPRQSRATSTRARTGEIVTTLIERDYLAIRRQVPGIEASSATVTGSFLVKHGDLAKNDCVVVGTEAAFFDIKNWTLREGQSFTEDDDRRAKRVAVLGAAVAKDLFNQESPIRQRLFINRIAFEVIGVLSERGQGLDAGNDDNQVYVPLRTGAHRLLNVEYLSSLLVSIGEWKSVDAAAADIESILEKTHRPTGRAPPDFEVRNQKALVATRIAASERLDQYVNIVGASALAMSGLGILAICWVSVGERNLEIGLRRAVGATARDVFDQFLVESAVISVAASIVGMAVSIGVTAIIAREGGLPFFIDYRRMFIVGVVAVSLNLTFAVLPSRRAAMIDPVSALRSA
jgi:putative ABC transport system permease protein